MGGFGHQDILVLERSPRDIEGVVAGVITAEPQGELSHLALRTARRGTPNVCVPGALRAYASLDGTLARLDVDEGGRMTFDPGFWIFIMRAKAGVTATQRIVDTEQALVDADTGESTIAKRSVTTGPTYKPHSGFGFGVRLGRTMYFMAEYNMFHYKFPEIEPFEREVAVSYAVSL